MSTTPFALRADPTKPQKEAEFRADLNVRLICPDCQNENVQLVEEFGSGDLVCGECGAFPFFFATTVFFGVADEALSSFPFRFGFGR